MFPRASWNNLLVSSPLIVPGAASSGTAIEAIRTVNNAQGGTGTGLLGAALLGLNDGGLYVRGQMPTMADALSNGYNPLMVGEYQLNFNGSTWDRVRNNNYQLLLPTAGRTTTTTTAIFQTFNARNLFLFLNVSGNPGGAQTLQVDIRAASLAATCVIQSVLADAFGGGNGTKPMVVGADCVTAYVATGGTASQKQTMLPNAMDIRITHSGAGSWAYSLEAVLSL